MLFFRLMRVKDFAAPLWLLTALIGAACSSSPGVPTSPIVPGPTSNVGAFSGVWQLSSRITACTGSDGCYAGIIGSTIKEVLRLRQQGSVVTGVLVDRLGVMVNVDGVVDAGGVLALTGSLPSYGPDDCTGGTTMTRLTLHLSAAPTFGSYELSQGSSVGCSNRGRWSRGADIVALAPAPNAPQPGDFAGEWRGFAIVRSCTRVSGSCQQFDVGERDFFDLSLTGTGTGLSGTLKDFGVAVTGAGAGDSLDLKGETTASVSGGFVVKRLIAWSVSRDDVGRLSGTFTLEYETHLSPDAVTTSRSDFELWAVAPDAR